MQDVICIPTRSWPLLPSDHIFRFFLASEESMGFSFMSLVWSVHGCWDIHRHSHLNTLMTSERSDSPQKPGATGRLAIQAYPPRTSTIFRSKWQWVINERILVKTLKNYVVRWTNNRFFHWKPAGDLLRLTWVPHLQTNLNRSTKDITHGIPRCPYHTSLVGGFNPSEKY